MAEPLDPALAELTAIFEIANGIWNRSWAEQPNCPIWSKFLQRTAAGSAEQAVYFQRVVWSHG